MSTTTELKPCPCCGGRAEFDADDYGYNWINCTICSLSTDTDRHDAEDCRGRLAAIWNRRYAAHGEQSDTSTPSTDQQHVSKNCAEIDFDDARRFLDSWGCMVHPIPQIIDLAERAALSARQAPEGCVIVPKEPTTEMLIAGLEVDKNTVSAYRIYHAMIAAAPSTAQTGLAA